MKEPLKNAEELLEKVVLAVVEAGHASDLHGFPDVLAYFGAELPGPSEERSDTDWQLGTTAA